MSAALRLVEGSSMDKSKALDAALSQIERSFGKLDHAAWQEYAANRDSECVRKSEAGCHV